MKSARFAAYASLALATLGCAIQLPGQVAAQGFVNPALKDSTPPLWNARVDGLDIDNGKLSITDCPQLRSAPLGKPICEGNAFNLTVNDQGLRTKLKDIHLGDHIRVNFTPAEATKPAVVTEIAGIAAPKVSTGLRLGMLLVSFLITFLLGTVLTMGHPLKLILGLDNRYSNSKLQAALWFWVLMTTYLEFLFFRIAVGGLDFLGGISIPQNLLLLSGMSAVTFVGAKGITTAKANAAADAKAAAVVQTKKDDAPVTVAVAAAPDSVAIAEPPAPTPITALPRGKSMLAAGQQNLFKDLFQNDLGDFDLGDFQMVVVTMLAVGTYMLAVHHTLGSVELSATTTLPDLDTTILSAFGLGQGAYLAKKAVGNASQT
jgi:hypothetical protein